LLDTARYVVRVPGAPVHEEWQEYGFGAGTDAFIRMPGLYVMQAQRGRLFLVEEGRLEPHIEVSLTGGLQAAVDSVFGGQGAPLAPAPLLLARAKTPTEMRDAFRMRLLSPLHVAGVRRVATGGGAMRDEVDLVADNGTVRASFDGRRGWLLGAELAFVPGTGADTIRAEARFSPDPTTAPPTLEAARLARGTRVTTLTALSGGHSAPTNALAPGTRFRTLAGAPAGIATLGCDLVVLEFWATWCAPCRAAIPHVLEFAQWARDSSPGVRTVLVNTEEEDRDLSALRPRVERYLTALGAMLPCWADSAGAVHRQFGGGLPLTVLLQPDGSVVRTYFGLHEDLADQLRRDVRAQLKHPH
jgi:thiol-disulfide isomerase/thioredoxin